MTKSHPIGPFLLLFSLVLAAAFRASGSEYPDPIPAVSSASSVADSNGGERSNHVPISIRSLSSRSLLSLTPKHETSLFASLDGTIYLVDSSSRKVHWSFSSGPSLCSSHQALHDNNSDDGGQELGKSGTKDNFFLECGDDWNLYLHSKHFGRRKLPVTVEEYIKTMPHITEDGGLTIGSKKVTVFLVDAKTGRVIHKYCSSDDQNVSDLQNDGQSLVLSNQDKEDWLKSSPIDIKTIVPLYITRNDYTLRSFAPYTKEVVWNMTAAEIDVAYLCQGDLPSDLRLGLEYQSDFEMPLPCYTKDVIYRTRDRISHQNLPSNILEPHQEVLSLPAPPTPNPSALSMLDENWMLDYQPKNSCEAENTCLMEIDDNEQIVPDVSPGVSHQLRGYIQFYLLLLLVTCVVGIVLYCHRQSEGVQSKQQNGLNEKQTMGTKKRKARKTGNNMNIANTNRQDKHDSYENEEVETDGLTITERNNMKSLLDPTIKDGKDGGGYWVGKLFVSNKEIATGSNGTIVFEGLHDRHRPVAVKRLMLSHNDVAFKEIENLIASDRHPNIVRWYGVEQDLHFVYLSLERCACSLNDLIQLHSDAPLYQFISNSSSEYKVRLEPIKEIGKNIDFWTKNGYPSSQLLKLMRDVVSGLAHLHELGIIHRDLKPQNVLISNDGPLCAKLSDMGISKRLHGDMSSFSHHATGYGSSGWQAPEQLLHGRQTRAVDLFSLGCLIFFCITKGGHPFGERFERDANIVKNNYDFFLVEHIPEAVDVFSHLLDPNPEKRPMAKEVLYHPLFWSSETRLSFLRDASDRVEVEDREEGSALLNALENVAPLALGGNWDEKLEATFITNIGRYRRYKYDTIRDLLRVIRNKLNHYRELPKEIQELLGPLPEGYYSYFSKRFPKLLIEVYKVIYMYCREEEDFAKYFTSNLI